MSLKWLELQILKEDGSVLFLSTGDVMRVFENMKNGMTCPEWDPAKDVWVMLIKFKEEDLCVDGERTTVLANYPLGVIWGDNIDNLGDVIRNHVIRPGED